MYGSCHTNVTWDYRYDKINFLRRSKMEKDTLGLALWVSEDTKLPNYGSILVYNSPIDIVPS